MAGENPPSTPLRFMQTPAPTFNPSAAIDGRTGARILLAPRAGEILPLSAACPAQEMPAGRAHRLGQIVLSPGFCMWNGALP